MTLLNTGNLPSFPTANGNLPSENSRSVPLSFNWANTSSYNGDLFDIVESGQLSMIQSVFIDNSAVFGPVTLTFQGTGQRIVVPAGWQGYFPVFVANSTQFTMTGGDNLFGRVNVHNTTLVWVNNFPMPASVWPANIQGQNYPFMNNILVAPGATVAGASSTVLGMRSLWLSCSATGLQAGDNAYASLLFNGVLYRVYSFNVTADGTTYEIANTGSQSTALQLPDGIDSFQMTVTNKAAANTMTVNALLSSLLTP